MDLSKITLEIFSSLEKKWLSQCQSPALRRKTRILCIDGDGSRGGDFVAGDALVFLEKQIKSRTSDSGACIADFFDLIAGTGLGGVVAAMLTAEDGNGRPLFSASEAVQFLREKRSEMFKTAGIFRRRSRGTFSGSSCDGVLREAFRRRSDGQDLTLRDTCKPLLVPCYDLNSAAPLVFSQADAAESATFNFPLWKVGRATSATPGRFRPVELTSEDGKTRVLALDGGLVMNNPSAAAVTHVLHNKRDFPHVNGVEDLMVLSLGNGPAPTPPAAKESSMTSVVGIALGGVSETVDQILGNAFFWNRNNYLRIQGNGIGGTREGGGGVLGEKAAELVQFGGKRLVKESNGERLEGFVERLVASGKALPPSPSKKPNRISHSEESSKALV